MIVSRKARDFFSPTAFAKRQPHEVLPEVVYRHSPPIRRKLGNVDLHLQENKAVSLGTEANGPAVGVLELPALDWGGNTARFRKSVGPPRILA